MNPTRLTLVLPLSAALCACGSQENSSGTAAATPGGDPALGAMNTAAGAGQSAGGMPSSGGAASQESAGNSGGGNGGDNPAAVGSTAGGSGGQATAGSGGSAGAGPDDEVVFPEPEKPPWTIETLAELREAIQMSDQTIVLREGQYNLSELPSNARNLPFTGSNNVVDLVGVYVEVPVGSTAQESYITVSGSNNTIVGGIFEDTYSVGPTEVSDYVAYNLDRDNLSYGLGGDAVMTVSGDDNLVDGIKLTVRGSYPYGYGSIYGIGGGNTFGLNKRCGILVTGQANILDHVEIQQKAFCHGIYIQPPADNTTVRNSLVEGVMRPSAELYDETDPDSLPARSDYKLPQEGDGTQDIPMDVMLPLSEDGIRVYTDGGSATVENCTVRRMRGGIRLYLASDATVTDSTAIDCGMTNFNLPNGGTVTGSSGNFAYAPLSDFRLSRSNQDLELTILPSPHAVGPHNIADVLGNNHNLVFHRYPGPLDANETRAIVVSGNNSTIRNETEYHIVVTGSGNDIQSAGEVTDNGSNNDVTEIPLVLE